jgi:RNA polymerase-associated protein
MTLYSAPDCVDSHRVRILLAEKNITHEVLDVDPDNKPEDLADLNPYNTIPTLVDRDLVLYDAGIIMEYLDERFPHPPLMPVDPVSRAKSRVLIYRIERDLYCYLADIMTGSEAEASKARKSLKDSLTAIAPIFAQKPYFMSEEFTLVDCVIAPLLWRLPVFGIELPPSAKPLLNYMDRLFERESFKASLTEKEKEMRDI